MKNKAKRDLSSGSSSSAKKNKREKRASGYEKEDAFPIEVTPIIKQLIAEKDLEVFPFHTEREAIDDLEGRLKDKKGIKVVDGKLISTLPKDDLVYVISSIKSYFIVKAHQDSPEGYVFDMEL